LISVDKKTIVFANLLKKLRFMWKLSPIIAYRFKLQISSYDILLRHVWITWESLTRRSRIERGHIRKFLRPRARLTRVANNNIVGRVSDR